MCTDSRYTMTLSGRNPTAEVGGSITMDPGTFQVFEILAENFCGQDNVPSVHEERGIKEASKCCDIAHTLQARLEDGQIEIYIERKGYMPTLRANYEDTARASAQVISEDGTITPLSEEETLARIRGLDADLSA